jgi:hypothetical protein
MAGFVDDIVISSIGFKAYKAPAGTWSKADGSDVTVTVNLDGSITGTGIMKIDGLYDYAGEGVTIATGDRTELDGNGFAQFMGALRTLKPVTLSIYNRVKAVKDALTTLYYKTKVTGVDFPCDYLFLYPDKTAAGSYFGSVVTAIPIDMNGINANLSDAQKYSIQLQPNSYNSVAATTAAS